MAIDEKHIKPIGISACVLVFVSCFLPLYTSILGSRNLISIFELDAYLILITTIIAAVVIYLNRFRFLVALNGLPIFFVLYNVAEQRDNGSRLVPDLGFGFLCLTLLAVFFVLYPVLFKSGKTDVLRGFNDFKDSFTPAKTSNKKNSANAILKTNHFSFKDWLVKNRSKLIITISIAISLVLIALVVNYYNANVLNERQAIRKCKNGFDETRHNYLVNGEKLPFERLTRLEKVTAKPLHRLFQKGKEWEILFSVSGNQKYKFVSCEVKTTIIYDGNPIVSIDLLTSSPNS